MFKNIWFFGDSFTDVNPERIFWKTRYDEYKGYKTKNYSELLCEKFNSEPKNFAVGGIDNETIFESIIDKIEDIKSEDLVIVNWSSTVRFRLYSNKTNQFVTFSIETPNDLIDIDNDCLNNILLLRDSKVYVDQIVKLSKLLKKTLNNKIIFWSPFPEYINTEIITISSPDKTFNFDFEKYENMGLEFEESGLMKKPHITISNDTNRIVDDGHYSEIGNHIIFDLITHEILKNII